MVVDESLSQRVRFWVDTDGDGDYSDETAQITSAAVDDTWSAGYVGLYRAEGGSSIQQYDDVQIGYDNNADGDIADAGDDQLVSDAFTSNVMSLTCDNNGNLTDDGIFTFVYDGWNRLVNTQLTESGDTTTIATYAFLGNNRRIKKVVQNCGVEETANDGGNTTVVFYYDRRWRMIETRNGSNQAVAQYVWGTRYTDEIIFVDLNGDASESNDCNPDDQGGESTADARYFYHQDRNWNVVAVSEYDTSDTNNGRVVERYSYTPYGQFVVLEGDSGSGELANLKPTSTMGSPFAHQGLAIDHEKISYQNRYREYAPELRRFVQPDPMRYIDGPNRYLYEGAKAQFVVDPEGTAIWVAVAAAVVVGGLMIIKACEYRKGYQCVEGWDDAYCRAFQTNLEGMDGECQGEVTGPGGLGTCRWMCSRMGPSDGWDVFILCDDSGRHFYCPPPNPDFCAGCSSRN